MISRHIVPHKRDNHCQLYGLAWLYVSYDAKCEGVSGSTVVVASEHTIFGNATSVRMQYIELASGASLERKCGCLVDLDLF